MIAIKDVIPVTLLPSPDHLEIITMRLELQNPVILCCTYISPSTDRTILNNAIFYLADLLRSNPTHDIVLVGDFNLPDINWNTLSASSSVSELFCDFVYNHNLAQLVYEPTHIRGNILDLVLTNSDDRVINTSVIPNQHLMQSDYFIITFQITRSTLPQPPPTTNQKYVFDFPKADYEGLCSFLLDADFSTCLQSEDVEFVWSSLKNMIYTGMNLFIPKVRLRRYQYPRWFTPELRHLCKCACTLRKRISKHPTSNQTDKLSLFEDTLRNKMSTAKSSFETNLIRSFAGKQNCKIYDYIKSLSKSCPIPSSVRLGSSIVTSDLDRASLFNQFFHSVFTRGSLTLPSLDSLPQPLLTINDLIISQMEVLTALQSLNPSKSMGIDGIGPKLLVKCALALYVPIHHLFSLSIANQVIPSEWKCHSITPIHKSGDKALVTNYRPISLLCIISKALERIVYDHLVKFILKNNIIVNSQFGFRLHHSTTQQLLLFLDKVHLSLNNNASCDVIYLDFKKAFDSVSHNELLIKLWNIGITGNMWYWIREYLTGRHQHVCINGCHSSTLPVVSGVPQGSILGPLLFLVYVNDLPTQALNSDLFLFADDTKCLKSVSSPSDSSQLQCDLDRLFAWSMNWKLSFNESKCFLLSIQPKHPPNSFTTPTQSSRTYFINSHPVNSCSQHKDLGILISHDLSWTNHLVQITSQAYKKLGLLRRTLCSSNSVNTKKILYISLVRSQLVYCSQIWRPFQVKEIKLLEDVQRRATKFILNDYTSSYKSRLLKLKLLPLTMLYELKDVCFFVKSFQQTSTSFNIMDFVAFSPNNTRSGSHRKLVQQLVRVNRSKQFYFNRLPRLWNSLPPIDLSNSYTTIVAYLKRIFWDHFISTFDQFNTCTYHYCCPCAKCQVFTRQSFRDPTSSSNSSFQS